MRGMRALARPLRRAGAAHPGGGTGGSNSIENAALLCGTPQSGCHGACERRDARYRAMGFWLYSSDEPQPVMLHGEQGGATVWLTDDGRYVTERAA